MWKQLDRLLLNFVWDNLKVTMSVMHLNRSMSDHSPLLISSRNIGIHPSRNFRFLNVWSLRHQFLSMVKEAWGQPVQGRPIRSLLWKLKNVKAALSAWNRDVFGNISDRVKDADEAVKLRELALEADSSELNQSLLHQVQAKLRRELCMEQEFWKQKAKLR
ncbi:uncharacterized protein [Coffea arabica]|uniref:Uncharacterized protein n=1 Tax=Coffea arabica TaxID=13443 RepID=A0ABM4VBY5_COFAR